MTKEQFKEKYNGKAVWCKTEELARDILEFMEDKEMIRGFTSDMILDGMKSCHFFENNLENNGVVIYVIDGVFGGYDSLSIKNGIYEIIEYKPEEKPKNLIPLIAKELGVEIDEEFKINGQNNYIYRINRDSGLQITGNDILGWIDVDITNILSGKYTIKKLFMGEE